jgi:hypothetical protein
MTAILAGPEFYGGEAPAVRNLVIRNNKFGPPALTAPRDAEPLLIEVSRNVVVKDNDGITKDAR